MSAEAVDAYLRDARAILGTGVAALTAPPTANGSAPAAPGTWNGPAADSAATTADRLHLARGQLTDAQAHAAAALVTGADIAHSAHTGMSAIESAWQSDKAALAPFTNTPEGQAALNRAGIQRISETQSLVFDIATQFGDAADEVRNATLGLPTPPPPGPDGTEHPEGEPPKDEKEDVRCRSI